MFTESFAEHFGYVCGAVIEAPAAYRSFCGIISHRPCFFEYAVMTALLIIFPDNAVIFLLVMTALGTVFSKQPIKNTAAAAAVTAAVFQLSFSVCGAAVGMISCVNNEKITLDFGIAAMLLGELFSVILSVFVLNMISDIQGNNFVSTVFMPIPIIFISGFYINHTILGNTVSDSNIPPLNNYLYVFAAAVFGIIGVYSPFSQTEKLRRLEYANAVQKKIIDNAEDKLDKTKALRHDLINHMTVLKKLVMSDNKKEAARYFSDLEENYSFPSNYKTGSMAADIIIADKFSLAINNKIEVMCRLKIPAEKISDVDICTLLSNALDNAVKGCESVTENKYIKISGCEKGDIFFINIENSFNGNVSFNYGTGIRNMKKAAKKYGGYVNISCDEKVFRTSIVLIISQH